MRLQIDGIELLIVVIVAGLVRYSVAVVRIGFIDFSSRNWYIKQTIIFFVALSLAFLYEQNTFTWLFATYYAELVSLELVVSIIKGLLRK